MSQPLRLAGREVGRYRVVSLLGTGGMGAVYDAVDATLGRHVALKILPPDLVSDADRMRRFAQEARAASALNHPHVITVYDIGTFAVDEREIHFISMEKVDGSTLGETLDAGALPQERAIELILQVTDAVAAAHAAGIVHRDLKPDNIMIAAGGYAKVLDFGLAKLQEPASDSGATIDVMSTQSGVVLGTAAYMAPERAQGHIADHRADLFSLGCILYEAVTGERAFRGASVYDTLYRIIHSEPERMESFVPGVPAELQRIVDKSLAKDPEDRYQSARDLSIDLRGLLRRMRTEETQIRMPAPKPRRAIVAASIGAVIVAALIAILLSRQRPPAPAEPILRRITSSGDVVSAVISRDGKYVSYLVSNETGQALRIRQLATHQELQLLPAARTSFRGQTFTPDGDGVLYVIRDGENPLGTLFRISTLGGKPERILEGIDNAPSFSPDGRRMAYLRPDFPRRGQSSLMIAASDGSGARPLATRQYPELFDFPGSFVGPSWSPDGSLIAAAINRAEDPDEAMLLGFNPESGTSKPLSDRNWRAIGQAAWMPDMSGIIIVATRQDDPLVAAGLPLRLWFLPYPSGPPRQLTNDLLFYRFASISSDGRSLMTVGVDVTTQLWRVPLMTGEPAQKITSGRLDGWQGVSVAPDGRIAYSTGDDVQVNVVLANADGSDRMPLTRETTLFPAAFKDGIAYIVPGRNGNEVRVAAFNGSGVRTIAPRADAASIAVTRDGEWLAYHLNRFLWKIRKDGTSRAQLTTLPANAASWSPAGDRIAFFYDDGGQQRLGIVSARGGVPDWSIPFKYRIGSTVRWTADGTALVVNDQPDDLANLWRVPFDKPPQKLTSLAERDIYDFDLAPDGKSAVATRGHLTRDAILITGGLR